MSTTIAHSDRLWRPSGLPDFSIILAGIRNDNDNGPGSFLRQARELIGVPESVVASEISIGVHQLRALESDDYENLPAPIFVRNYLRRYSELLGLPVDDVVACYERMGVNDNPQLARVSIRERLSNRNVSVRWATASVSALVLAILLFWWQTGQERGSGNQEEAIAEAEPGKTALNASLPLKGAMAVMDSDGKVELTLPPLSSSNNP